MHRLPCPRGTPLSFQGFTRAAFGNSQASPTLSFRVQIYRPNQEDDRGLEQPPECHSLWGQSPGEKLSMWQTQFTLLGQEWFKYVHHH